MKTKQFYLAKGEDSQNTKIKRFSDELGEIHYAEGTSLFSVAFVKWNKQWMIINYRNIITLAPLCNLSSSAVVRLSLQSRLLWPTSLRLTLYVLSQHQE